MKRILFFLFVMFFAVQVNALDQIKLRDGSIVRNMSDDSDTIAIRAFPGKLFEGRSTEIVTWTLEKQGKTFVLMKATLVIAKGGQLGGEEKPVIKQTFNTHAKAWAAFTAVETQ